MPEMKYILALVLLIIVAAIAIPQYMFAKNVKQFNMTAEVMNISGKDTKIGFAAQTYELNFGRLPAAGRSTKFIDISNTYTSPAKLKTELSGNITPFIDVDNEEILLEPQEDAQIRITFNSREIGNYSGNLMITSYMPKYRVCSRLLKYI